MTDDEMLESIVAAWWEDTDWRTFGMSVMKTLKDGGLLDERPVPIPVHTDSSKAINEGDNND